MNGEKSEIIKYLNIILRHIAFYTDPFGSSENERKVEKKFQISKKYLTLGAQRALLNSESYNNYQFSRTIFSATKQVALNKTQNAYQRKRINYYRKRKIERNLEALVEARLRRGELLKDLGVRAIDVALEIVEA